MKTLQKWKKSYPFQFIPSEDDQPMKPQEGESPWASTRPTRASHVIISD
jgi:hypothetical protein